MLDLTMPGRPPLDALRDLCTAVPETRVIAFSGHDDQRTTDEAIRAGAWELISKHCDPVDVINAIRRVALLGRHP
jgi:DNA-binding NarL/FixJ family response regulator